MDPSYENEQAITAFGEKIIGGQSIWWIPKKQNLDGAPDSLKIQRLDKKLTIGNDYEIRAEMEHTFLHQWHLTVDYTEKT